MIEETTEIANDSAVSGFRQERLVSCTEFDATVREVAYPRRNQEAHDAAFDEHERLMADGWETLGGQEMTPTHWRMRYVKRS